MFRENCFDNVVSDLTKKWPMCPQNYKKKKKKHYENVYNLWRFWGLN